MLKAGNSVIFLLPALEKYLSRWCVYLVVSIHEGSSSTSPPRFLGAPRTPSDLGVHAEELCIVGHASLLASYNGAIIFSFSISKMPIFASFF